MVDVDLYPHTCTIQRRSQTQVSGVYQVDEIGNPIYAYATSTASVPCMFDDKGLRELARRYIATVENPRLFVAHGTDVIMSDRVTSISVQSGTFEVVGIRDPGGYGDHLEIELERVSAVS